MHQFLVFTPAMQTQPLVALVFMRQRHMEEIWLGSPGSGVENFICQDDFVSEMVPCSSSKHTGHQPCCRKA